MSVEDTYDPKKDVEALYNSMKGAGTDEKAIIEIIANRKADQRQKIKECFQQTYNKDLQKELESELSGNFEDVSIALFDKPAVYDAKELYKAMKGIGTDEKSLIEIITSRAPSQMEEIKKEFQALYNKSLEEWVKSELSGELLDFMLALLKCQRDNSLNCDKKKCEALGRKLAQKQVLKWEGPESDIYQAVILSNPIELSLICRYFHKFKGKTIVEAINNDFSSDLKLAIQSVIFAVISPSEFCATHIYESMKGIGTNNKVLIRMLITRDEIDLPLIKKFYHKKYDRDMIEDIKSETSGDYQEILVQIASHK